MSLTGILGRDHRASHDGLWFTALLTLAALAAGLLIAVQPLPLAAALLAGVALLLAAALTPLAALVSLLVFAPLRTLIATESALVLPLDIGQLALFFALASWFVYRGLRRQIIVRWTPLYLPLLLFVAAGAVSSLGAPSLTAWLSEWLKWVEITALVLVVMTLPRRWEWLVFALVLAGAANALIGIYQFFGGSGALHLLVNDRYFRAFGTFGQPNPFGGFMGLLAPLALMAALGYGLRLWRRLRTDGRLNGRSTAAVMFYAAAALLLIAGVVLSWSRGAWLGFAVAGLALGFALPRRLEKSLLVLMLALAFLGLLWITGRLPDAIIERVNSATAEFFAFDDVRGVDITPANYAVVERLAHWQAALNMSRAHPWLGVGLGNYEAAYPSYRLLNWDMALGHAHNYYLNVLAETGIIGLVTYSGLWLSVLGLTWSARRHPDPLARCTVIGLFGTWVYLSVHSFTDNLYVNNLFVHIGVMLGILAVLHHHAGAFIHLRGA